MKKLLLTTLLLLLLSLMSIQCVLESETASADRYIEANVDGEYKSFNAGYVNAAQLAWVISLSGRSIDNSEMVINYCAAVEEGNSYVEDTFIDGCGSGAFELKYFSEGTDAAENNNTYLANENTAGSILTITITEYGEPGEMMSGTYSGTLCNNDSTPACIQITNGKFMVRRPQAN